MSTDYRALCAELIELDQESPGDYAEWKQRWTATVKRARAADLLERLAVPEPVEPTDDELHQLWLDLYASHDGPTSGDVVEIARAVLARWGR